MLALKDYTHLFFDLDHTLWDYERNSAATLKELYEDYDLSNKGSFSHGEFISCFTETNDILWDKFHRGEVDQEHIRRNRFKNIFEKLGSEFAFTEELSERYISTCPTMGYLLPGAIELLDHLAGRYEMHIITNGFTDIQHTKLDSTGLTPYFGEVIISGHTGFRKPQREIFDHALKITDGQSDKSIMIGDSLESDIQGAKNAEIDQVFFNPKGRKHSESVTYEVESLLELKELGF